MQDSPNFIEVQEQAALFALGASPLKEAKSFQQRLDSECPVCMAELRECQSTVDKLALAAPQVPPPAGLRARLFERIGRQPPMSEGRLVRACDTE
jgi:hypothetical protein